AKTARIAATRHSETRYGCRPGKLSGVARPVLPHSWRRDSTTELIGFQSATGCSQLGSVAVGMNALDRNVIGNSQMNPADCATSTLRTVSPMSAAIQLIA